MERKPWYTAQAPASDWQEGKEDWDQHLPARGQLTPIRCSHVRKPPSAHLWIHKDQGAQFYLSSSESEPRS